MNARTLALALGAIVLSAGSPVLGAWEPPLGIPTPSFGINEVAGATTLVVQGSGSIPKPVPAGAVILIQGTYARDHSGGNNRIQCAGTAQKPAFIRGAAGAVATGNWEISGSYCIVEKLKFGVGGGGTVVAPAHHITVRDNEFVGTPSGSGGIGIFTGISTANASDIVLLRNNVHHTGDWQASFDQDAHGTGIYRSSDTVGTSATISNVWILDSQYSYNSGDGVQINANGYGDLGRIHHVYIGRNVAHHNKQTGFWSKEATDVIFSQNEAYEHRPSNSSEGACMGYQYGPEYVWFLFNRVHDCSYGVQVVSDNGGTGKNVFLVGNVIYRIHGAGAATSSYTPSGIHLRGGTNRYLVGNTIYDADVGITSPASDGFMYIVDNLIATPAKSQGSHVFLENPTLASASGMGYNLFGGSAKIRWGGPFFQSLAQFNAGSGKTCTGCLESQPSFVNAAGSDFHLKGASPGVDGGVLDAVYSAFTSRYGIKIELDAAGRSRPLGAAFDVGAYETDPARALTQWHPFFAVDAIETPYVGDFNGDGKSDIITFTRQNPLAVGDVYVALSTGTAFGSSTKWNDWFAINSSEQVVIGDYDGDGRDDIATWLSATTRQVYVASSYGSGMTAATVWSNGIGVDPTDVLAAGDVNADGREDLVLFARRQGKVYVALSQGNRFSAPTIWHNFFAVSTYERPAVADLNGDRRVDIVTFATDSPTAFGDVYVALSDGTKFGDRQNSAKWHDWFAIRQAETVRIGDMNGDGMADFFTFLPPPYAQCYTASSAGTSMSDNVLWPEAVAPDVKDRPFVGDANGDGKADIIVFAQGEGKVYVSLAK